MNTHTHARAHTVSVQFTYIVEAETFASSFFLFVVSSSILSCAPASILSMSVSMPAPHVHTPQTILAAVVVVALYGMFKQVLHLIKYWKLSKLDFVSCGAWSYSVCTCVHTYVCMLALLLQQSICVMMEAVNGTCCVCIGYQAKVHAVWASANNPRTHSR